MANVNALVAKLRELFNIQNDRPGVAGVYSLGGIYNNVAIEINDFMLCDHDFKKLQQAK